MTSIEQITKVVVPVAGMGTRLLPATKSQPKEMLPVGRRPVVQYVVEEMEGAGVKQILFVTGRKKTAIEDHFDADPELVRMLSAGGGYAQLEELAYTETEARFYYTRQSEPRGLADAVFHGREFIGQDHFVVALGDSIIKSRNGSSFMERMIAAHLASGAACTVAVEEVDPEDAYRYGIVRPAEGESEAGDFAVADLIEKPQPGTAPSNLAIAARYVFSPAIFDAIRRTAPDRKGELQLTDSIRLLIQLGEHVRAVRLRADERRYDIGNFESYFRAFIDFALDDEKYGYMVRQYVKRKARDL
jgi:UTP--glucose-1-phosphate uridylyltransferase